jgi:hypothetical protein
MLKYIYWNVSLPAINMIWEYLEITEKVHLNGAVYCYSGYPIAQAS